MSDKNREYLEEIISLRCKTGSGFVEIGVSFCELHGFEKIPFVPVHEVVDLCRKYPVAFLEVQNMIKGVKEHFERFKCIKMRSTPFPESKIVIVSTPHGEEIVSKIWDDAIKVHKHPTTNEDFKKFTQDYLGAPWVAKKKD